MRLTVRTLLAWIDGVLAPGDHQALGEKVAASDVAPRLVERVRAVVRRDGVSTPAVDARGLADDPNTAAEFLDNVLDGEQLQAFERVCLESDMHLADVASCHALLAEATRTPEAIVPVEPATRQVVLAILAAERPSGAVAEPPPPRGARRREAVASAQATGPDLTPPQPRSAPVRPAARARRAPAAAWVSAIAAVAVVLVLGGVLAWSLVRERAPRRAKPTDVAAAPSAPAPAVPAAAAAAKPPVAPPPPPPAPPADPTPQAAAAEPVAADEAAPQEPSNAATAVVDPQPPKTAEAMPPEPAATPAVPPSAVAAAPPVADTRVPHGDALAIVAPLPAVPRMPAVDPAPAAGATPPPEEPPSPSAASVSGGPLLRRVGTEAGSRWMVVGRELPLEAREDLLVPLWCRATITIDGIEVVLQPATRCSLARDADGTPRLEVIFGRATVSGRAADARVGVTAAGLSGVLAGMLEAPAAIDVPLDIEPGEQPRRQARLWVGAAEKVWRQTATDGGAIATPLAGVAEEALLAARSTLAWSDRDPAAATIEPPASEPAWIRATAPTDRVERDAVAALAAALAAEPGVAAEEPLEQLASHRRAENRMIAAATLALLGDYGELVAVLSAEPPGALGERQWTVLESLSVPLALARGDNSAAALAEAFAAHGPAGKAETLLRLARGLTADDLASGGDAFLVEALADDSLMVRRYAIRRLEEIVPPDPRRRGGYRADREGTLRDEGIAWWRAQLEQGRIRR